MEKSERINPFDENSGEDPNGNYKNQQDKSQGSGFWWTSLKFIGYIFLGIGLTAVHYVFNVVAAGPSTVFYIGLEIKNLYQMAKPKGFLQWLYYVFRSSFVTI